MLSASEVGMSSLSSQRSLTLEVAGQQMFYELCLKSSNVLSGPTLDVSGCTVGLSTAS